MIQPKAVRRARAGRGRGRPVLAGMLVLTLVSMLAATAAVGARPAGVDAQDSALETASVTPASALLYASINLDTASDQFAQSQELAERAGLLDLFASVSAEGEGEGLADLEEDLPPFLGGEAGLVVTSLDAVEQVDVTGVTDGLVEGEDLAEATPEAVEEDGASGVALVVRAADPDAAHAKARELQTERAEEAGATVETTEYEGVTIESVAADESLGVEGMAVARVGDFVVVAGAAADIEPIVDTQAGTIPPLSERAEFGALRDRLNDAFMLFAFIDGPTIKEAIAASGGSAETLTAQNLAAFDAYTGVVMWADEPGFRLDTISVPTEGAAEEAGNPNFDGRLDERLPGDTLLYTNGVDLGATGVLDALGLLIAQQVNGEELGSGAPEGTSAEDYTDQQFERASAALGFDLRADFVDQMVGEYAFALRISNFLDPSGIGALLVSGVENPTTLADAVKKISFLVAAQAGETTSFDTREVEGATVNVIEDSSLGLPLRLEYGVVGDQFILGLGDSLQDFVDGPADSLAANAQYQEVLATLPTEHGGIVYVDLAQVVTLVQSLVALTGETGGEILDASEQCGDYADQDEAQAAYDEDPGNLIDLDQDFDGEACEDYFNPATPEAAASPADIDLSALRAFALVSYQGDRVTGTSSILYISAE